jgi:hypothetical protein
VTAHGTTSYFAPRKTCCLERDFCFYVVHLFLKDLGELGLTASQDAGTCAIEDVIEDVEYVIMCGEDGAYGYVMCRFCQSELAKHVPVSHYFYTYIVSLPGPATKAHARIDCTLVHTPQRVAMQYAHLSPVALRRWGIRNSDRDKHTDTESLEEILAV